MRNNKFSWKKYFLEFISIFVGVSLAFSLSKWNENRTLATSETKTLLEIKNGLKLDLEDLRLNIFGHQSGIKACDNFRKLINNEELNHDSIPSYYFTLLRDFVSVQNKSGYESLKSQGLQIIQDDSLRLKIITTYDFYFEIMEKLEENYAQNQFNTNYYHAINNLLAKYMVFDDKGTLIDFKQPMKFTQEEKNLLLSYLWRIEKDRNFTILNYRQMETQILELIDTIDRTIEK